MSDFSDRFCSCMSGKELPAPVLESANDLLELVHQVHSALEALGAGPEMTLKEFVAAALAEGLIGPEVGAVLLEGGEVIGAVLVQVFVEACVACLVFAAGSSIRDLFANAPPSPFVREQLAQLGVEIGAPEGESASA